MGKLTKRFSVPPGYALVPIDPSRIVLRAMSNATWLTDGSPREMARRWNGALTAIARSRKHRAVMDAHRVAPDSGINDSEERQWLT